MLSSGRPGTGPLSPPSNLRQVLDPLVAGVEWEQGEVGLPRV